MKYNKIYLLIISSVLITSACKKEKLDSNSVFVDSSTEKNPLDNYIYNNYILNYNVDILYKYVDKESNLNYNLVPASYNSSIRLTKLFKYLGFEPYDDVTGSKAFIKRYFPKLINFIGEAAYNNNGTRIVGTAEGAKKITLYEVNALNATTGINAEFLTDSYFHTIHHEFQHILNQTTDFPSSFQTISGTAYVDDVWNTVYPNTAAGIGAAIAAGFISPYASNSAKEDFAELFSFYITLSATQFNAMLNVSGSTAAGRTIINNKLMLVKNYMQTVWNIDMDVLRANIVNRKANLATFDQTTL
ncbi:putative zinc-binding metallopeptidase [Pedobacter aquatilis]|uniref:zinc-binding metallopeptidase n=1 Tax=Pedobacter aquatilis TaxID=351343 RepID=UPI0025B43531|nr:putative zinc-binding metallopeptidase [Pedobacter aquatilis]MDN3585453.1 putative zinc-binding metallopeptidase [Pedobacter aquatilis]